MSLKNKNMNKEMFLFIVAFILRIYSVRTDDDYGIETAEMYTPDYGIEIAEMYTPDYGIEIAEMYTPDYGIETAEMDTSDYVISTATSFLRKTDEVISKTDFVDKKKMPSQNFDPDVYNVWNQKSYRPYTPPNMPNIDDLANWKLPTMNLDGITVPTITYGRRGIKDYKLFFAIFSVVLLVMVTLKLFVWLRIYFKSKELQRNDPERIVIIRSGSDSSQSDTVPSNRSSAPNRSVLLNFPAGLHSSNSGSRSRQTEPAVQKSDSKRIVILIPVNSQKDDTEHPQRLCGKYSRLDSCKGVNAYPEPPPPYE